MMYDYEKGYALIETADTVKRINARTKGRPKIRYDIVLRDGNLTVVHNNLTTKEVAAVRAEIERQGNKLW